MPDAPPPTGSSPTPPAQSPEATARIVVAVLYISGAITIVAGIVCGLVVDPIMFAIALVGVVDFTIARLFASGRVGPLAARRRATASGEAASVAESDPSFNPYARED